MRWLVLFLLYIFCISCVPETAQLIGALSPEEWGSCDYPTHPGDFFYEKNYEKIKLYWQNKGECRKKCRSLHRSSSSTYSPPQSSTKFSNKEYECNESCNYEALKYYPTSMATCKDKGIYGYYSDGSYYDSPRKWGIDYRFFNNTHELKDKYDKTKWQKARDECMQKVSEIKEYMKFQRYPNTAPKSSPNPNGTRFYNECLKERGF